MEISLSLIPIYIYNIYIWMLYNINQWRIIWKLQGYKEFQGNITFLFQFKPYSSNMCI